MVERKRFSRIDVFENMDAVFKFWELAEKRGAKTRKEMEEALEAYKKADLIVEEHKERMEAHLAKSFKMLKPKLQKGK